MDEPENWRWIWLGATVFLAVAELIAPGSFFLISFALGALIACVLAFFDVSVGVQWLVFALGSGVALAALVPIGRRINASPGITGVGATRLDGRSGVVLNEIPAGPNATGLVRVEREEWRAESINGEPVPAGASVRVVRVDGTRLVVTPEESP